MSRDNARKGRGNWTASKWRWWKHVHVYIFATLLLARTVSAQPACGQRTWIAVAFSETSWPAQFGETVLADLRASLSERRIDVCLPEQATVRRPIASITFTAPSATTVAIEVVATDEKGQKRAARTVSLANVPSDGQPFAVALATDELLQASWSELALFPPEVETHQPVVEAEPQSPPPPPPPPPEENPNSLTGAALFDWFFGRQEYAGGELRLRHVLSDDLRWSLEGGLGGSLGKKVETANGNVNSSAAFASAWLRYGRYIAGRSQLGVGLGTRLGYHVFTGTPVNSRSLDSSVTADTASGLVTSVMGKVDTRIPLDRHLYCDVGVEFGVPLRSLEILDSGVVVTGATGFRFTPSLGVGYQW